VFCARGSSQLIASVPCETFLPEDRLVNKLNPTLADGLWPWRQRLNEAAMVISTLLPEETVRAATEFASDLAQEDRAVVLTCVGATEPLFWHVPAGREFDTVRPDVVLMLVPNYFTPSMRLLLATARDVVLITGSSTAEQFESLKVMQFIVERASPSHIEVVVVADGRPEAREAGASLVRMARGRLGERTSWRHLSARRVKDTARSKEEGYMSSTEAQPVPMPKATLRAREWEESFRRAEKLLLEAQEALRRQLDRPASATSAAPPAQVAEDRPRAM